MNDLKKIGRRGGLDGEATVNAALHRKLVGDDVRSLILMAKENNESRHLDSYIETALRDRARGGGAKGFGKGGARWTRWGRWFF
jgi:hypothetical protein